MQIFAKNKSVLLISLLFALIYSLISFYNHYNFRTYALDLGAYTNALYDYLHFQWNDSSVFKEIPENLLADHFDLYLILFSPFTLIFGTYTLLFIQIIFLIIGGLGIYFYFKANNANSFIALFASIYFYLFFGVFAAVSFDYHSNVIAASIVPWFFYLILQRKIVKSAVILVLMIISKENISLWLAFVCIGLAIEYWKNRALRLYLIFATIFCFLYFYAVISFIMPAISNNGTYPHFNYSILGDNFISALWSLINNPVDSLKILFINHPLGDFVKIEFLILLICSGFIVLFRKPHYVLMLIPIFFQKLYHDSFSMWSIGGQYCIEFAPIMAIGIFSILETLNKRKMIKIFSVIVLLFSLAATIRTMDNTVFWTNKAQIRFYKLNHYKRDYNVKNVHEQLAKIPPQAIVSAQSPFLPHLSLRNHIYQFPIIKDAAYVVYSEKENTYPISQNKFNELITEIRQSGKWQAIYDKEVVILKKFSN